MTTIASTLTCMAADSGMVTAGGVFATDKLLRIRHGIIGAAGYAAHCAAVIEWLDGKRRRPKLPRSSEFSGLYLTKKGLFYFEYDLHPNPINDGVFAIGSGAQYALGSMMRDILLGAEPDPLAAIEVACIQDALSHGPVSFLTLGKE